MSSTVALVEGALVAYAALTELGETVEDEWQYVTDLSGAWRARLLAVAAAASDAAADVVTADVVTAVGRAIEEVGRIEDPHRAIDWLSTFPQVVLLALGAPDAPPEPPPARATP